MTPFTAAVVQMRSTTDMAQNITAMTKLVEEAAAAGATYIQTPEMTGLVEQERENFFATIKPEDEDPVKEAAQALAAWLNITLHIGSTPVQVGERMAANRAYVFAPTGALLTSYDKIHMFDVDLDNGESWRESAVYRPGEEAVIVNISGTPTGLAICYDCRFPALHRDYAQAGALMLTGPSCFTRQTGQAHWHALLRARAIENGAFMVAAAQGGDHADGRTTHGHSLIINPWGKVIGEVKGEEPGFALAEIDPAEALEARAKIPNLKNGRDYELVKVDGETLAAAE
ncbi:MAG: carbon-nitrogen hydrolase family protein [Pseudomonadota bacterium]